MGNRNILLLVADDLGREQMSCYGCRALKTPNLDALAASGTLFDKAFTSTASCSGSRTVMYTGLHTHQNGCYGLTHGDNGFQTFVKVETAPALFNELGYKTGILGKVHVGPDSLYPWQTKEESESRNVAMVADRANHFFAEAKKEDQSFFLTIGFVDPHRMLQTRSGFGNTEEPYDDRLNDRVFTPDEVHVPPFLSDIPEVRKELAEYYRSIHRMDQGVGLILKALEVNGLAKDTMVVFCSDNGPPFVNSKTTLFEAGVRLPFLMRAPGVTPPGTINSNLISYIDILPTFLDWAGYKNYPVGSGKQPRSGRSFIPIAGKETLQPGWDRVFGSHTFHEITNYWPTRYMRSARYKYHRNVCWKLDFPFAMDLYASLSWEGMRNSANGSSPAMIGQRRLEAYIRRPPEELYDLDNDPLELRNLVGDEKHGVVLKEMRDALEAWQKETKDLWLWRDGIAVMRYSSSGYAREGLKIPDRWDFDAQKPQTSAEKSVGLL
jgi:N-sulfoglucosamine sulfohydrolase